MTGELFGETCAALHEAMLAAVALRAGRDDVPEPAQQTLWVYGELSRRGVASTEEVGALIQAQLMAQTEGEVPTELVQQLMVAARGVVAAAA